MTFDAACRRSKVDSTHDFPATLERHGGRFDSSAHGWQWKSSHVKEPDCLDAVGLAKQVDRRHDSRLDKSPSVWTLARDVASSVPGLNIEC
jgi:hypothetical protein